MARAGAGGGGSRAGTGKRWRRAEKRGKERKGRDRRDKIGERVRGRVEEFLVVKSRGKMMETS